MLRTVIIAAALLLVLEGCFLMKGHQYRQSESVVVATDHPSVYAVETEGAPGERIGTSDMRAGDTITILGYYYGGLLEETYCIVRHGSGEAYLLRSDVLTADDQLYRRLGPRFDVALREDPATWERARTYLVEQCGRTLQVASDELIKTAASGDTTEVAYLITRVPTGGRVEYEIVCTARGAGVDADSTARGLAFYMVSGRRYRP